MGGGGVEFNQRGEEEVRVLLTERLSRYGRGEGHERKCESCESTPNNSCPEVWVQKCGCLKHFRRARDRALARRGM